MAIAHECKCVRCGHEWISVLKNKPRACASCKCINWDVFARECGEQYIIDANAQIGGTLIFLPWPVEIKDLLEYQETIKRRNRSVSQKLRRMGIKYNSESISRQGYGGIRFWRVA